MILHPSYNDHDATADLAVIKISKLIFTEYVQPICIWGPVYDKASLFGYQATVSFKTFNFNLIIDDKEIYTFSHYGEKKNIKKDKL